jgi:hypothetical protein
MNSKMPARPYRPDRKIFQLWLCRRWLWTGPSSATFRADFSGDVGRIAAAESMSRSRTLTRWMEAGFSGQDMRQQKNVEPIPIQAKRDVL